ncbi:Uncharacterised protein [Streptococcus pneumoniae]|nr:Uncharacterised protein [Streptococcus pneumoniae]CKI05413.1 Uncharacterised protein [Streptococcus pneumoniae]
MSSSIIVNVASTISRLIFIDKFPTIGCFKGILCKSCMIDRGIDCYSLNFISNCTIFICYMVGDFYYSCFIQSSHSCTWFTFPSHLYSCWFLNLLIISIFKLDIVSWIIAMYQGFIFDLSESILLSFYSCWIDFIFQVVSSFIIRCIFYSNLSCMLSYCLCICNITTKC